jgi:hypothetical protein
MLEEERDLDCMYFNRSLEFFRIYIWFDAWFLSMQF